MDAFPVTALMRRKSRLAALALILELLAAPAAAQIADWLPAVVEIPAGPFIAGSDAAERELAYRID